MDLAQLTTAGVGGPAASVVEAATEAEIIEAVTAADDASEPLLIVGGGSNLLVGDDGFDGTVLRITSSGYTVNSQDTMAGAFVEVAAGHDWDDFVHTAVRHAWSGIEALSGVPGLAGATPVQNVGAYGADVSATIARVRTWDRRRRTVHTFANADLQFGYRDSLLKRTTVNGSPRYVVLSVEFQFPLGRMSAPIKYAELARMLGVETGRRAYATDVRRTVLRLRAGKGMVLDPEDRDTYGTGSFFTNPIVDDAVADTLPEAAPRYPAGQAGRQKLSAAWLIEQSGFAKGYGLAGTDGAGLADGRACLSTKHTLAVTNRGGATTSDMLAVARAVRDGVDAAFGIRLEPEPLLVGCAL